MRAGAMRRLTVVSGKERRKALARAKWERQQARRTAAQRRNRRLSIIGGSAVAVVAAGAIGWGGYALITNGDSPGTTTPTENFPSFLTPTSQGPTAYSFSSGPSTSAGTSQTPTTKAPATTPTTPANTGTSSQ